MDDMTIQKYFERNLGETPAISAAELPNLPHFARRQFRFLNACLFGKNICLLVSSKDNFKEHNLQELESVCQLVYEQTGTLPVFVFRNLAKQERLLLIKRKIEFLVPGLQMFLPQLGLELYDRIPKTFSPESAMLRPAAQAMLLEQLLTGSLQGLSVNKASQVMGYTAMGTLRAADQLNELKLCNVVPEGRGKILNFSSDRRKLWTDAAEHLRNPIKKMLAVKNDSVLNAFPFAGEYALGLHSDLSVSRKCYALHQTAFKKLLDSGELQLADSPGSGIADVQIWSYTLPSWQTEVDLLSLELSFKGNVDPRIKIALLELEEQRTW